MARKIQKIQKDRGGIAIIVDGKDEEWYINKVKECYPCEKLKQIKVKPELPTQKNEEDLFKFAKDKLDEGYSFVILILDLDKILKEKNDGGKGVKEFSKFTNLYTNYLNIKAGKKIKNHVLMSSCLKKIISFQATDEALQMFSLVLRQRNRDIVLYCQVPYLVYRSQYGGS